VKYRNQLDKQNLSENIEFALFALDELLDEGLGSPNYLLEDVLRTITHPTQSFDGM